MTERHNTDTLCIITSADRFVFQKTYLVTVLRVTAAMNCVRTLMAKLCSKLIELVFSGSVFLG